MAIEYIDGSSCPICDGVLEEKIVTEIFSYKGKTLEYPDYLVHVCNKCGEEFVGDRTMKQSARVLRDFYRQVDGLLSASDIKRIRVKLGRTQEDMSSILGGGLKAFARYENSDVIQSEPMDNLLRILDEMPHSISIIENKNKPKRKVSTCQLYDLYQGKLVGTYDK